MSLTDARQIITPGVRVRTIKTVSIVPTVIVDRQELATKKPLAPVTQIVKVGTAKPNHGAERKKQRLCQGIPLTYADERVEKINFTIQKKKRMSLFVMLARGKPGCPR